MMPDSFKK